MTLTISPDLGAVYDNRHPYLAECGENARGGEWLSTLDKIELVRPQVVVAGHGLLDPDGSPSHIREIRRYNPDLKHLSSSPDLRLSALRRVVDNLDF